MFYQFELYCGFLQNNGQWCSPKSIANVGPIGWHWMTIKLIMEQISHLQKAPDQPQLRWDFMDEQEEAGKAKKSKKKDKVWLNLLVVVFPLFCFCMVFGMNLFVSILMHALCIQFESPRLCPVFGTFRSFHIKPCPARLPCWKQKALRLALEPGVKCAWCILMLKWVLWPVCFFTPCPLTSDETRVNLCAFSFESPILWQFRQLNFNLFVEIQTFGANFSKPFPGPNKWYSAMSWKTCVTNASKSWSS